MFFCFSRGLKDDLGDINLHQVGAYRSARWRCKKTHIPRRWGKNAICRIGGWSGFWRDQTIQDISNRTYFSRTPKKPEYLVALCSSIATYTERGPLGFGTIKLNVWWKRLKGFETIWIPQPSPFRYSHHRWVNFLSPKIAQSFWNKNSEKVLFLLKKHKDHFWDLLLYTGILQYSHWKTKK